MFFLETSASRKAYCKIADSLMEHLNAKGVLVIIEAEHLCMSMRGSKKAR